MTTTTLASPEEAHGRLADAALATVPFLAGRSLNRTVATPGAASPSYHAVESHCYLVTDKTDTKAVYFLKIAEPAARALLDPAAAFAAASRIAALGLAPEPLHLAETEGAILFRHLGPDWRPATLAELRQPERVCRVIEAFRHISESPDFGPAWTVFDGIRQMRGILGDDADTLPPDAWWLFHWAEAVEQALTAAGIDYRPAHADPHASNLMFGPDGALRLVDFDMACDTDPHYQLGAFLNEACQFDSEMKFGIEIAEGSFRADVFNRCRAYAAMDDLYWGLRALVMDRLSPRTSLEFRKYAGWRLLRCRMLINRPGFEETLRTL